MFNVKNGLNLLSATVLLTMLLSCSNNPYSGFEGIWKSEAGNKINVVKIYSDGDDYFMTNNLLSKNSQKVSLLVKEQGMLILDPKTFKATLIESTDIDNVIKIKKNKFTKITEAELTNLENNLIVDSVKFKGAKVKMALSEFYLDTGKFPNKLDELIEDTGSLSWMGPYIKNSELTDSWGNEYIYEQSANSVKLVSLGKDNKVGGDKFNQDFDFSFSIKGN